MEIIRFYLFPLVLMALIFSPLTATSLKAEDAAPEPEPALELLYSANALYNRKLYDLAAEQYAGFLEKHGGHEKVREARLGYALSLFGAGKMESAEPALADLAGDDAAPSRNQVYLLWGQSLLALERYEEAGEAFGDALGLTDEKEFQERYLAGLIEALFQQEKAEELAEASERLVALDAESAFATRALYQSGLLLYKAEEFADALPFFERVAGRDEALDGQVHFLTGECHRRLGDLEAAAERYEAAVGSGEGQHHADSLFRLGFVRFLQAEFEQARQPLEAFMELEEDHPAGGQARFYLARVHFEGERFDEALKGFDELAGFDGHEAEAALWRGKTLLRQDGKGEEAAAALARVSEIAADSPEAAEAGQLLAYHHYNNKDYEAAAGVASGFLESFPEHRAAVELTFLLGESVFLADEHDEAIRIFEGFRQANPEHEKANAAMLRLAQSYSQKQEWEKVFELTAGIDPEVAAPEALYLGGVAAYRLERWPEAASRLGSFVSKHPGHSNAPAALLLAAVAHGHEDDEGKAVAMLETLVSNHEESSHRPQGMLELARLKSKQGEPDQARSLLEGFLAAYPEHEQLPRALSQLGWIESETGEHESAAARFGRLAGEFPDHDEAADARLQQALLLEQTGDLEGSRDAIQAFLGDFGEDPRRDQALYHHGSLLMTFEQWDPARGAFEGLLNEFDESPLRDRALYQLAWVEREAGNAEEAEKHYRKLIDGYEESSLALNAVIELAGLEHLSEENEALIGLIEPFLPRLAEDPDLHGKALYRLGAAHFGAEAYQDSASRFEALLEIDAESELAAAAAYHAGEARLRMREYGNARDNYEKVLAADAAKGTIEQTLLRLGEVEALLERWPESEQYYRRLIDEFSDGELVAKAHLGLGWTLENQGNYDDAIAAYRVVTAKGGRDETTARS